MPQYPRRYPRPVRRPRLLVALPRPLVALLIASLLALAIIGVAGRYAMADNVWEFWDNLASGRDCIVESPLYRWAGTKPRRLMAR